MGTEPCLTFSPQPQVYCSRYINAHMVRHHEASGHPLVLSYVDLSTWCYPCQAYVHHQVGPGQTHPYPHTCIPFYPWGKGTQKPLAVSQRLVLSGAFGAGQEVGWLRAGVGVASWLW